MNKFSDRLQWLISYKKIQQVDLVEGAGVTESMVSHWLDSKKNVKPQMKSLVKLSDYFMCDMEWLRTGTGEPFPSSGVTTAEKTSSFNDRKEEKDIDSKLAQMSRLHFKQQCGVFFDELFDFVAENYGEDKHGVDLFLKELHCSHANYRDWLRDKELEKKTTTRESSG